MDLQNLLFEFGEDDDADDEDEINESNRPSTAEIRSRELKSSYSRVKSLLGELQWECFDWEERLKMADANHASEIPIKANNSALLALEEMVSNDLASALKLQAVLDAYSKSENNDAIEPTNKVGFDTTFKNLFSAGNNDDDDDSSDTHENEEIDKPSAIAGQDNFTSATNPLQTTNHIVTDEALAESYNKLNILEDEYNRFKTELDEEERRSKFLRDQIDYYSGCDEQLEIRRLEKFYANNQVIVEATSKKLVEAETNILARSVKAQQIYQGLVNDVIGNLEGLSVSALNSKVDQIQSLLRSLDSSKNLSEEEKAMELNKENDLKFDSGMEYPIEIESTFRLRFRSQSKLSKLAGRKLQEASKSKKALFHHNFNGAASASASGKTVDGSSGGYNSTTTRTSSNLEIPSSRLMDMAIQNCRRQFDPVAPSSSHALQHPHIQAAYDGILNIGREHIDERDRMHEDFGLRDAVEQLNAILDIMNGDVRNTEAESFVTLKQLRKQIHKKCNDIREGYLTTKKMKKKNKDIEDGIASTLRRIDVTTKECKDAIRALQVSIVRY